MTDAHPSDAPDPYAREDRTVVIDVPPGQEAVYRLDVYLTQKMANVTRAKVQRGIKEGRVTVNGAVQTKASTVVQPGDAIACTMSRPKPIQLLPEPIPLDILFEDDHILVLEKPAGLVVHPAYGHPSGTLVNALLHHVGARPETLEALADDDDDADLDVGLAMANAGPAYDGDPTARPGLVHRLDKDTSGLMIAAKHDRALAHLGKQFADRTIRRLYLALVWGVPNPPEGRVETWLGRDPKNRKRVAVRPEDEGKWAATNYETVEAMAHTSLCRFKLETGRTHQIRVHAKHLGHPILGDQTYGGDQIRYGAETKKRKQFVANLFEQMPRQALHAHTLGFEHPVTGEQMDFTSPLPADMQHVLDRLRAVEP